MPCSNVVFDDDHLFTTVLDLVEDSSHSIDSDNDEEQNAPMQTQLHRRGTRIRHPPQFFKACHKANVTAHIDVSAFNSKYDAFQLDFLHPTVLVVIHDVSLAFADPNSSHSAMLASNPTSLSAATNSSNPDSHLWAAALDSEIASLVSKQVFTEDGLPPYARAIGTRPLFVTKRGGGKKVRLGAQGLSQCPGSDYMDTFAHVCWYASLRSFIALAAKHSLTIRQLDVKLLF